MELENARVVRELEENRSLCRDDENWKDETLEDIRYLRELQALLATYKDVLNNVSGHTKLLKRNIEIGDAKPVKLPHHLLCTDRKTVHQELQKVLDGRVVELTTSE